MRDNIIQNDEKKYFKMYDIETIWHEFGHTLWLDLDTESVMNETGNFKNIEEFKATAWGLVTYFLKWWNSQMNKNIIINLIHRSVNLIKAQRVDEMMCYYTEGLVHLDILFESGMIHFDWEKIICNYSEEKFKKLSDLYIITYKKLIYTYLEKEDASNFLYEYTVKEGKYFFPKSTTVRKFVEYYYDMYEKIGNEIQK